MKLDEYLTTASGKRLGLDNPRLKRLSMQCLASKHTIYSIALGRRFASPELAAKIEWATEGRVEAFGLVNHARARPGRAPRAA